LENLRGIFFRKSNIFLEISGKILQEISGNFPTYNPTNTQCQYRSNTTHIAAYMSHAGAQQCLAMLEVATDWHCVEYPQYANMYLRNVCKNLVTPT